jgi:hypothetical protein
VTHGYSSVGNKGQCDWLTIMAPREGSNPSLTTKILNKMKYNNNTPFEEFMYRFAIVFGVTVITLNLIILVSKLIG